MAGHQTRESSAPRGTCVVQTENRLIDVRQGYERQMDQFKFFLGLPMDCVIELDKNELQRLAQQGLTSATVDADTAVEVALVNRPDFHTVVDRVVDAERKSRVSADALRLDCRFTLL